MEEFEVNSIEIGVHVGGSTNETVDMQTSGRTSVLLAKTPVSVSGI